MQVTTRILALILGALVLVAAQPPRAVAQSPQSVERPRPLASAMEAMRNGDWAAARRLALLDGQVAADIIEWHRLRAGRGAPEHVMDFVARRPDWPGMDWLRKQSEAAVASAPDAQVLKFFADTPPQTATGALAHARALTSAGEIGGAEVGLVLAWRTMPMGEAEQSEMIARHGALLAPHHAARLDYVLWQGWQDDAERMLPLVSDDQRRLAEARLGLQRAVGNVDTLIDRVPEALAGNAGLAHARFEWRMRKGRTADALELLRARSTSADALGDPEAWARRRRQLARDLMRDGDDDVAYEVASRHYLVDGAAFADLEWLSGYLALRRLDQPDLAVQHFTRFLQAVETPISLGRGGYWLGRAYEAAGQPDKARAAYAEGAKHQTSFYGQLAAERGGLPPDPDLAGTESFGGWKGADFTKSSVYNAAILLLAADELSLAERFFTHLAESLDREQIGRMGELLADLGQPHIQVMLGKRAADYGTTLPGPYYALHPLTRNSYPVPLELVLSIARRESEFDQHVISGAGARGLMQVMPSTARAMAGRIGLPFDSERLLTDWAYNARLGSTYLREMADDFDGNPVMIAAAYNAGPGRPRGWMERFGDPRTKAIDIVDWIEMIPFDETRNYVMRVTESLPVYRARLGRDPHPVPFSQELAGSTLLPLAPEGE